MLGDRNSSADVLVVLTTLVAEGTPVMTLDLCKEWMRLGIRPAVMTMFRKPDDMRSEFEALGVRVHEMAIPTGGYGRYLALVREAARICRDVRPSAVLSMPLGWHAFVAIGAKLAGVPLVAAHVGSYPKTSQSVGFRKFKAEVLLGRPFTSVLICCSEYVKLGVETHFSGFHGPLAVVYNGTNVAAVGQRAESARLRRPPGRFTVGMVARLERSKDHDTLLDAVALAARTIDLELHLVGDGSRREELRKRAEHLGITDRVVFLGSRRDVPEVLGQLDAFVFSVRPDEGLGIALIEAMAARVPVVATDVGACREVLGEPAVGILVPFGDAARMAEGLVRMAQAPTALPHLGAAAARAARQFSTEAMAAGYSEHLGIRAAAAVAHSGSPHTPTGDN